MYEFTIGANGLGSGSFSTSNVSIQTTLSNIMVSFDNGMMSYNVPIMNGLGSLSGIPIAAGTLNTLTVSGVGGGNASYGGNLTFAANAVPEPAAWALMLLGFGAMGMMIRRRKQQTSVSYAF